MSVNEGEPQPLEKGLEITARMALVGGTKRAVEDASARANSALRVHDERGLLTNKELESMVATRLILDLLEPSKSWDTFERTGVAIEEIIGRLIAKLQQVEPDGPIQANNYRLLLEALRTVSYRARNSDLI